MFCNIFSTVKLLYYLIFIIYTKIVRIFLFLFRFTCQLNRMCTINALY